MRPCLHYVSFAIRHGCWCMCKDGKKKNHIPGSRVYLEILSLSTATLVGTWQTVEMSVASASCDTTLMLVRWLPVNMNCDLEC